jgi:hypothetical protein
MTLNFQRLRVTKDPARVCHDVWIQNYEQFETARWQCGNALIPPPPNRIGVTL